MKDKDTTSVWLKKTTVVRIKAYGKMGSTFDQVLNQILDRIDEIEKPRD